MGACVVLINDVCVVLGAVRTLPVSEIAYVKVNGNITLAIIVGDSIAFLVSKQQQ